jgi:predicted MFS family arabinose efflux permease
MALLALGGTKPLLIASATVFGLGFGTAYPVYVGYVMQGVSADRRGAAFGAILAAFDTGIGTGSTMMGLLIQKYGFQVAFGVAAAIAALALPYFLAADRFVTNGRRVGA